MVLIKFAESKLLIDLIWARTFEMLIKCFYVTSAPMIWMGIVFLHQPPQQYQIYSVSLLLLRILFVVILRIHWERPFVKSNKTLWICMCNVYRETNQESYKSYIKLKHYAMQLFSMPLCVCVPKRLHSFIL